MSLSDPSVEPRLQVRRGRPPGLALLAVAFVLSACGIATVEDGSDPASIPDGPLEARGAEAIGPVTEIERGRSSGLGWRYSVYESADGTCTQLELASVTSAGCGPLEEVFGDGVIGAVSHSGPAEEGDIPTPYDGLVSSQVAEVWLVTAAGQRIGTTLMSLADAGHDAQAFLGFAPAGANVTSVVATDASGAVLGTFDLP
jgi:hypothetical protein